MACRILVPQPGIEPHPSAMRVMNSDHWTTREFLKLGLYDQERTERRNGHFYRSCGMKEGLQVCKGTTMNMILKQNHINLG